MDMTGERRIPAPRQAVWEALNDPEVLKVSIPGCESSEAGRRPDEGDRRREGRPNLCQIYRQVATDRHRPTERVPYQRRGARRRRRLRQRRCQCGPGRRGGRHAVDLPGERPGRRQARATRRSADRRQREADGRQFFDRFSRQVQAMSPGAPVSAAAPTADLQPSAISVWSLIPHEPFGLPIAAWIGGAVFVVMVLLILGSML